AYWLELPRDPAELPPGTPFVARLPEAVAADCVSLVVAEVWPATAGPAGATGLAEVAVVTDLEAAADHGAGALASRVAAGGAGAVHAARRAADLGPAGEAALVEAFDGATRDGRRRLV